MTVYGVADVERATSTLVIGPTDVITPLARDRAAERGITIEVSERPAAAHADTPPKASPASGPRSTAAPSHASLLAGGAGPPSGALYRRGAPPRAGIAAPDVAGGPTRGGAASSRASVAVVGAGHVGATTALRLAQSDLFNRVALVDAIPGLAAGLALDIWHGASLSDFTTSVDGSDDIGLIGGADYLVVSAGRPREPGMTRTDLTSVNAEIVSAVAQGIRRHAPRARVIVVTNPVEEMTHVTERETGFPPERVMGMAGVLDSARFCSLVGLTGRARPSDVTAYALGSHGPEMLIPLSQAFVGSTPIERVLDRATLDAIVERTRESGAEIVELLTKGSAYFSPAEAVVTMVRAMATRAHHVMTACVRPGGAYGLPDSRVGLPVRLGPSGVEEIVSLTLLPDEEHALRSAAASIAARLQELG